MKNLNFYYIYITIFQLPKWINVKIHYGIVHSNRFPTDWKPYANQLVLGGRKRIT